MVVTPIAAPLPALAQTVHAAPRDLVQIATGRGRMVTLNAPMSDIFVADSSIADVQVRSPTQLWVFGKKSGETTVYATTKGGKVVYSATIRIGNNFDSVQSMLAVAMPEADITATTMNGFVLLTGTVAAPSDAAEAERLAQAFVGDEIKVLSRLRTATPLQVNLQVRIAEVSRSFVKNIGVNLASADLTGGFKFGIGQGRTPFSQWTPGGAMGVGTTGATGTTVLTKPATGTGLFGAGKLLGLDLLGSLDLGEQIGQVSTLANPNLTALSGETGSFLAGGEIPIPVSQGLGAVSVEYKQYGVSLAYTPTVLSDGRISLRVRPEVSQLSSAGAVTIGGTQVPALTTRRAETTVELGSGQSLMIGGLLQNTHDNSVDKAPGLGDIPILGALFRSNGFKRNETELVIVITPYLVKPVNGNEIALPTDGYRAPTDAGRIILGQLSGGKSGEQRPMPQMAPPAGAAPSVGAMGQVPLEPQPQPAPQPLATPAQPPVAKGRDDKRKKSAAPAPGFGFK
ncbi:type II and III secretion system protein family protein [Sphingomonas sp.]|uniref:type II and III secretion system protein family protein n=1 Tax=Sphingomonas sp. TaxID=28214 RepID=UPI0025E29138|nr:type II and III secretion system protein family protein [Sphingomonas sp.]